ncbi:MAG: hypothetical protein GY713_15810, partial [Actinomycetia bacterium]|nr:hypothetical protein [Actinomycetes bacterium]
GKFLAIAGTDLVTLSDTVLDVTLTADAGITTFDFGVFDGDAGEIDTVAPFKSRWDIGAAVDFTYALFASPPGGPEVQLDLTLPMAAPGACVPTVVLGELIPDPACSILSWSMPNNDWIDFAVASGPEANAPSGIKVYRLEVRQDVATGFTVNVFKVRTTGQVTIRLGEQPFSYASTIGALPEDIRILTPQGDFED